MTSIETIASAVTARLWTSVVASGAFKLRTCKIQRHAFTKYELSLLSIPSDVDIDDTSQQVALADGIEFERFENSKDVNLTYHGNPRTRIYESINVNLANWYTLVAAQLTRLARCRVVCALYSSNVQDCGLGIHTDGWDGIVMQVEGEKLWYFNGQLEDVIVLRAGDVLMVPEGIEHNVTTPHCSKHIVFALVRRSPL